MHHNHMYESWSTNLLEFWRFFKLNYCTKFLSLFQMFRDSSNLHHWGNSIFQSRNQTGSHQKLHIYYSHPLANAVSASADSGYAVISGIVRRLFLNDIYSNDIFSCDVYSPRHLFLQHLFLVIFIPNDHVWYETFLV